VSDHPSASPTPPAPDPVAYPDARTLPAQVTLVASIQSVITDLADLLAVLPGDVSRNAEITDRLSEEVAEASAMIRALPGRPASMTGHDCQMLAALRTAHASGEDVGETIARALARLAAELGGSFEVLKARPGSWEVALIAELLRGTVGPDDENLPMYGGPGGSL
jgi:hypothetical protein